MEELTFLVEKLPLEKLPIDQKFLGFLLIALGVLILLALLINFLRGLGKNRRAVNPHSFTKLATSYDQKLVAAHLAEPLANFGPTPHSVVQGHFPYSPISQGATGPAVKREPAVPPPAAKIPLLDPALTEYVKTTKALGHDTGAIKAELLKVGWNPQEIDRALNS